MSEHTFRHGMRLSEHLMAHIDAVLQEGAGNLNEVDAFAVGIGPGSFTGTRIGVMTAKTLAWIKQRPIYGIHGLMALALEMTGTGDTVVPILPCRADVVFAGGYRVTDGSPETILEPGAWSIEDLKDRLLRLDTSGVVFCGEAVSRYRDAFAAALCDAKRVGFGIAQSPRASQVGAAAWARRLAGDVGEDVMTLVPEYISPPPISLPRPGNTIVRADHQTR